MRLGKVDFPEPVVAAARNRELVVFAGAGVSMGEPAGLPGFRALTEKIAEQSGESELDIKKALDSISPDKYLGRLKDRGTDVHALAAEVLLKPGIRHTELHRVLLSLYPKPEAVRVVTTNYDLLFEQAVGDAFPVPTMPATYSSELPTRKDFQGIVHLHGDVAHPSDMVLTKNDFAVAYLSENPWAQRFVINLLSTNTLLFVGYSGNDVIFDYLISGLLSTESPRHFAMVKIEDEQEWLARGVQPICCPTSPGDSYGSLCESLSYLSRIVGESVTEQQSRIERLAAKIPSELNREEIDLVADALSDTVRLKFFTRAATSPEWIAWLDEGKYIDALFEDKALNAGDRELARWLAGNFMFTEAEELFALIGKHELRLHVDFWGLLLWQAQIPEDSSVDLSCLERWVSLLLSTAPHRIHHGSATDLFLLGEHCIKCGLTDSVVEIFEALADSQLVPDKFYPLRNAAGEFGSGIGVELSPAAEPYEMSELWQKGLRPHLFRIASRLFPTLSNNLAKQYRTLRVWGTASQHWDPTSFHRSAIEPHEQDRYPEAADAVIDAARDCLQWLAKHKRDMALCWCDQLATERAPILRRLAVHALTQLSDISDFGPDEKIDRFLLWDVINDNEIHHEIFQAMQSAYPRASRQRRRAVIDAVLAFQMPSEKDPDGVITAYEHFNWFHWLFLSDSDCDLTVKARDQVLAEHPEFRPREHPDFQMWTEGEAEFVEPQSPWTADQLLAEPAGRWVSRLHEYCPEEFSQEMGLCEQVTKAAQEDFEWGADLADALAADGEWGLGFWEALLKAWAKADERAILKRRVFRHLSQEEMMSRHPKSIAHLLYAWARSSQHAKLHDDADRVAMALWPVLHQDSERQYGFDWLATAINCPAGVLAQFWFARFNADGLHGSCREALSVIVQDQSISGRLGRTVLASGFLALLQEDEEWTRKNLLPFFELRRDKDIEDCRAVWEGFLYRPRIGVSTFHLMEKAFHAAVEQLQDEHRFLAEELRKQFLRVCATIVTDKHLVLDPLKKWLPHVLRNCSAQDKGIFTAEIGRLLGQMSANDQEELWHRWLGKYWQLRRHGGIAGSLTREETTGMFHWLPCLRGAAFVEAAGLAVLTVPVPDLRHGFLFRRLGEAGLYEDQSTAEAAANLLLFLDGAKPPEYAWHEGGKLIRKLWALEIPAALKNQLRDLAVSHNIPIAEGNVA